MILVISVFIVIIVTKVIIAFMCKLLSRTGVCSKSGRADSHIGRYGYKSSFGANNMITPEDEGFTSLVAPVAVGYAAGPKGLVSGSRLLPAA